jgi:hypothetical protein
MVERLNDVKGRGRGRGKILIPLLIRSPQGRVRSAIRFPTFSRKGGPPSRF